MSEKVRMFREVEIPWTRQAVMRRLGRIDLLKRPEGTREGCFLVQLASAGRGVRLVGDRLALFSGDASGDDFRTLATTLARALGPDVEDDIYVFDPPQLLAVGDWV